MRKLVAFLFALVSFNVLFFLFLESHRGEILWFRWGSLQIAGTILSLIVFQFLAYWPPKLALARRWVFAGWGVAAVSAVWSVLAANPIDQTLLYIVALGGSLVSLYSLVNQTGSIGGLLEIVTLPLWLFLGAIESLGKTKENVNDLKRATNFLEIKGNWFRKDIFWPVFWGLVLAIPVLVVILVLLTSGDPVFAKYFTDFFKWDWDKIPWWIVGRAFWTVIFGFIVIPWTYVKIKNKFSPPGQSVTFVNFGISVSIIVGAIALLLGTFLLIEAPYVFATVPEDQLHKFGINTYSEYATRGFMELLVVSMIVFAVSTTALMVYKKATRAGMTLKTLNLILLSEALLFIVSILRRVYMYQEFHGLTRVRVYGSTFLIFLIVLTLILMARHARARVEWFMWEVGALVVWIFLTVSLNTDNLIANYYKPTVNKEVDYVYISRLSPEAYEGWIAAYDDAKKATQDLERKFTENSSVVDKTKIFSDDERRRINYAHTTLNTLRRKMRDLTFIYGTNEEINAMRIGWKFRRTDPKEINFKEKMAYEKLKEKINHEELIAVEEKSYKLYSQYFFNYESQGKYVPQPGVNQGIDRSFDSPFVEDVQLSR